MARVYTLKRRAEQQAETRERIVEAAVALHSSIGPAATSVSLLAERAGVQRHTVYAHFPDDRALLLACSGHVQARDPLPAPESWAALRDKQERLRTGLTAIYAWFERNADLLGCVMRDAEQHPLTKEITDLRFRPFFLEYRKTLGSGLSEDQRAMLGLALSFFTWRSLVRDEGLKQREAVEAMMKAIVGA